MDKIITLLKNSKGTGYLVKRGSLLIAKGSNSILYITAQDDDFEKIGCSGDGFYDIGTFSEKLYKCDPFDNHAIPDVMLENGIDKLFEKAVIRTEKEANIFDYNQLFSFLKEQANHAYNIEINKNQVSSFVKNTCKIYQTIDEKEPIALQTIIDNKGSMFKATLLIYPLIDKSYKDMHIDLGSELYLCLEDEE